MKVTTKIEEVNTKNFFDARITGLRETPDSPNTESILDVELFGCVELREIRITRNRHGHIISRLPKTLAYYPDGRKVTPAVWISNPSAKYQFDLALESALASYTEVSRG